MLISEEVAVAEDRDPIGPCAEGDSVVDIILVGRRDQVGSRKDEPLNPLLNPAGAEEALKDCNPSVLSDLLVVAIDPDHDGHAREARKREPEEPEVKGITDPDYVDPFAPDQAEKLSKKRDLADGKVGGEQALQDAEPTNLPFDERMSPIQLMPHGPTKPRRPRLGRDQAGEWVNAPDMMEEAVEVAAQDGVLEAAFADHL